ncbi:hypothetical protein M0R45_036187 [Rubus argutus]|uniref:Uncharacterized protein n=1 Tax=Rubus argutus TaxID=59490 RepID=A0AAW1VZI0_RUBAR
MATTLASSKSLAASYLFQFKPWPPLLEFRSPRSYVLYSNSTFCCVVLVPEVPNLSGVQHTADVVLLIVVRKRKGRPVGSKNKPKVVHEQPKKMKVTPARKKQVLRAIVRPIMSIVSVGIPGDPPSV